MKKTLTLFSIILLFAFRAQASEQTTQVQNLLHAVDSCKQTNDTLGIARAYFALVKYYDKYGDIPNLSPTLDSALCYAIKAKSKKAEISILTFKAAFVADTGNHDDAIEIYRRIHTGYLETGDTTKAADMLINIGMEYNDLGKYEDALNEELTALKLREQIKSYTNIAVYYQRIGEVYKQLDQKEKWREYFLTADSLARTKEEYANFYTRISILNDMGGLHEYDGELEKAKESYKQMYALCEKEGYINGMSVSLSNLVPVLKQLNLKQEALEAAQKALVLSEKIEKVYHIISQTTSIGELYLDLNQPHKAIPYFNRAIDLAKEKSFKSELAQAYKGLYRTYKSTRDFEKALDNYEKHTALSDSIKGVMVKNTVAELETKYETEKKEQQIKLLTLRDAWNKKVRRTLYLLLGSSLLLLAMVIFVMRLRRKVINQQKELFAKQREISHITQEKLRLELDQKNRELSSVALQMASKQEFLTDLKHKLSEKVETGGNLNDTIREIDQKIKSSSDWDSFRLHFEEVHPNFFKRLKERFPALTPHEERLCAFIKLNLSTKEIANINNNTTAAVDKSRNRLRKKLNITADESIKDFLEKAITE